MKTYLFLFTKKYPYHYQETYLENELPILSEYFDEVIIVPHDEFDFQERRDVVYKNVFVWDINRETMQVTFKEKIKREWAVWNILLKEIWKSREKKWHLKYFFRLLAQLRHLYTSALKLDKFIKNRNFHKEEILFYNYWLHRGCVIGGIFNRYISKEKVKMIARAHALDLFHKDWNDMLQLNRYLFLPFEYFKIIQTDCIYSISEQGINHLRKYFPEHTAKFKVSRLGVIDRALVLKQFRVDKIKYILVSCSHIDNNKRLYLMPAIISYCKKNVYWTHIGMGEDEDIQKLKDAIKNYGVDDRCCLLGKLPYEKVIEFYQQNEVDLFVNLSKVEGIPVSMMEAASFGIPLLATDAGANSEIVSEESGFLIPVQFSVKEVAKLIDDFFDNVELIKKKREGSRKTFETKYDAMKNYLDFVNDIKY